MKYTKTSTFSRHTFKLELKYKINQMKSALEWEVFSLNIPIDYRNKTVLALHTTCILNNGESVRDLRFKLI